MKTKLFTLILLVFAIFSFAQNENSEHLSFKGVPIDGTLEEYVLKMKQKGFVYYNTKDGVAMLTGEFAGYRDCVVGVSTLKQNDLVYKIAVIFSDKDTWSMLYGNYFDLKKMLTEKYGAPSDSVEEFNGYTKPDDDNSRMYNVKTDRCKYYTTWKTVNGEIQLSIHHISVTNCFVKLDYIDEINNNIIKAKAKDDL